MIYFTHILALLSGGAVGILSYRYINAYLTKKRYTMSWEEREALGKQLKQKIDARNKARSAEIAGNVSPSFRFDTDENGKIL